MTKQIRKPKIIVFEGIDGAGKSTQIRMLKKFFNERDISYYCTREPGGCPNAEKIRKTFLSSDAFSFETQLLLCTAARKEHIDYLRELQKSYEYEFIIFDRFIDSTLAYQVYSCGRDHAFLTALNNRLKLNIEIDLTILLDIDPRISVARRRKPGNHFDTNVDLLIDVRQAYLDIWQDYKDGKIVDKSKNRVLISANNNPRFGHTKIIKYIKQIFNIQ